MSSVYDLAQLRADLDNEFAPLKIQVGRETLVLRNVLRINDSDRKPVLEALETVQSAFSVEDENAMDPDQISKATEAIYTIFRAVVADGKGDKLIQHVDGDLALAMKIMNLWAEASQPGEASSSPS